MTALDQDARLRGERGLTLAMDRLMQARLSPDPEESFTALKELLDWAVALDDWHGRRVGKKPYVAQRNSHPTGMYVAGFRYARNRAQHDLAQVVEVTTTGFVVPLVVPLVFHEVQWRPLAELPPPERPDPDGAQAYANHLAGQVVRLTVNPLRTFLVQEVWTLGTP